MSARVLECAHCGAPVAFRAPQCLYCHAPQTWGDAPPRLERGASILTERYPPDTLLGSERLKDISATRDGVQIDLPAGWAKLGVSGRVRRNACVAVTGAALSGDVGFGALVRAYRDGPVFGAYIAIVVPGYRAVALSRILEGGGIAEVVELTGWESSSAVRGVGEQNCVEVRCADSVFEVLVNDVRVLRCIDAGIGCGELGWRTLSLADPGRLVLRALEAFEVVAS